MKYLLVCGLAALSFTGCMSMGGSHEKHWNNDLANGKLVTYDSNGVPSAPVNGGESHEKHLSWDINPFSWLFGGSSSKGDREVARLAPLSQILVTYGYPVLRLFRSALWVRVRWRPTVRFKRAAVRIRLSGADLRLRVRNSDRSRRSAVPLRAAKSKRWRSRRSCSRRQRSRWPALWVCTAEYWRSQWAAEHSATSSVAAEQWWWRPRWRPTRRRATLTSQFLSSKGRSHGRSFSC